MRTVARRISSAVMIWRPLIAPSRASLGAHAASLGRPKGRRSGYPTGQYTETVTQVVPAYHGQPQTVKKSGVSRSMMRFLLGS